MAAGPLQSPPGLLGLYAKAALGAIPLRRWLPGGHVTGGELADLTLRLEGVAIEPRRLAAYRRVCGFDGGEPVPATYLHLLAFPLHLALLTDPAFPFTALGAVHIGNTIEQRRPIQVDDTLALTVRAVDLALHPRGRQITLVSEADIEGDVVWREQTVLLNRESSDVRSGGDHSQSVPRTPVNLPAAAPNGPIVWRLPGSLGRQYAAVSGDRNPIHLYDLTAKPLGFSRHVAHGMWTTSRALAELSNQVSDAFTFEVAFKKPITLPGSVRFGARNDGVHLDLGVSHPATGAPHLLGRLTRV